MGAYQENKLERGKVVIFLSSFLQFFSFFYSVLFIARAIIIFKFKPGEEATTFNSIFLLQNYSYISVLQYFHLID